MACPGHPVSPGFHMQMTRPARFSARSVWGGWERLPRGGLRTDPMAASRGGWKPPLRVQRSWLCSWPRGLVLGGLSRTKEAATGRTGGTLTSSGQASEWGLSLGVARARPFCL